jgi:hypothetical protein
MHIQQSSELPADFFQRADSHKPEAFIEMETRIAALCDPGYQCVELQSTRLTDDCFLQLSSDTLTAILTFDIE